MMEWKADWQYLEPGHRRYGCTGTAIVKATCQAEAVANVQDKVREKLHLEPESGDHVVVRAHIIPSSVTS